jgi:hypothetical protein
MDLQPHEDPKSIAQVAGPWVTVELCHGADLERDINAAQFDNPLQYTNQTQE